MSMPRRRLGLLDVPALGLGCMGMSWAYGPADENESLKVLRRAFDLGANFWDTAEIYGPFVNEELLGRALKEVPRDQVIIATKFAWEFNEKNERVRLNGSRGHIKKMVEGSLKRLGTDYIDLYYQHRVDPQTPIEETVGAMGELVKEGKVRHIGLSEASSATIRRAHRVHPLTAVQSEYSLWERGVEAAVLPTLSELGIGFVPYSPMGRGFLTGAMRTFDDIPAGDWRRNNPRFSAENFAHNFRLVEEVESLARKLGATSAQVALAWLLKQGENIVPIPCTKRVSFLEQNCAAANLQVSTQDWAALESVLAEFKTQGDRYTPEMMKLLDE